MPPQPPPPPATPSPHRFVIKKQAPIRRTPLAQEQTDHLSSQQFNATPRFNFSSVPRPTQTQSLPPSTPSATRYITPARQLPTQEDVIENSSDGRLHGSIETEDRDAEFGFLSGDDNYKIDEPGPKRRCLSSSPEFRTGDEDYENQDELPDSSLSILSSPPATRPPISKTAPRFLISAPVPPPSGPQDPQDTQTAFLKPPRFLSFEPLEQAQSQADPLPEQFSPHRRGQKYVGGGLAAEVRDWLVNIESSIPTNSAPRTRDDPWSVKIAVDEVAGGGGAGMTLIRGRQTNSSNGGRIINKLGVTGVVLAGDGAGTGLKKGIKVEKGKTVGIRGPLWEVVIEGEKWGVGVDWEVLPL